MNQPDANAASAPEETRPHATGSLPSASEPVFLVVGKLRRPHGLRGELVMEVWTDFPERLRPGLRVYIGAQHLPARMLKTRQHAEGLLVTLEGYSTREAAGSLRNQYLYVNAAEIPPLPEGEYYHHQLLGLRVFDEHGNLLGKISEILATGANDVFVVQTEAGTELLIPFLRSLLIKVDLEQRELHTRLLPGLREAEQEPPED